MASFTLPCIMNEKLEVCYGPNPTTVRGAGIHVYAHPREPKIIYPSGKYVIVRHLETSECFVYRGHNVPTTVAKFSPNGFWVASADVSGKVRVWSWDHPEKLLKIEVPVFAGEVKDLDWDHESKKIVAVGDGSGQLAKVFVWDTGSSVGEMLGHNKRILSVAYRPARPFRIFTASEDMSTIFYEGPPFRLNHSNRLHTNFVNCIRFSPDGSKAVSVGSDKKIQLYDGRTGEPTTEIACTHTASVYSVAWSADGTKFLTASADKTVKLWNVTSGECETTFTFSEDSQIGDYQVAVVWTGPYMISVSLNGNINYLDPATPSTPRRVVQAHQVAITCMTTQGSSFYTASFDGVVCSWDGGLGTRLIGEDKRNVAGAAHGGKVSGLCVSGPKVLSVGWDDTLRTASLDTHSYAGQLQLNGQPVGISIWPGTDVAALATLNCVMLTNGAETLAELSDLSYQPSAIAIFNGEEVAVGGKNNKVYIYASNGSSLTQIGLIEGHRAEISALAYSPTGDMLAVGDANRTVNVYVRGTWEPRINNTWVYHTTRIMALSWSPSGQHLASGALDEQVIVWDIDVPRARGLEIPFAHKDGVTGVAFLAEDRIVTSGNDHCICVWNLSRGGERK